MMDPNVILDFVVHDFEPNKSEAFSCSILGNEVMLMYKSCDFKEFVLLLNALSERFNPPSHAGFTKDGAVITWS